MRDTQPEQRLFQRGVPSSEASIPGQMWQRPHLRQSSLSTGELLPVGRGRDFADAGSPDDQDGETAFARQFEPLFHAGFDFRLVVGVGGDDVCALALEGLVKPEGIGLPGEVAGRDGEGCPPVMAIHSLSSTILRPGTWRNTVLRVASMPLWHSVPSPMMLTQRAATSGFERT